MNKNAKQLKSFTEYCNMHKSERFWQALTNWSGYGFVYGQKNGEPIEDTYYKE